MKIEKLSIWKTEQEIRDYTPNLEGVRKNTGEEGIHQWIQNQIKNLNWQKSVENLPESEMVEGILIGCKRVMNYGSEPAYTFFEKEKIKFTDITELKEKPSSFIDGGWVIKVEKPIYHKQAKRLFSDMWGEVSGEYFLLF